MGKIADARRERGALAAEVEKLRKQLAAARAEIKRLKAETEGE